MIASIVITTYNRPKLLRERALKSALNQNFWGDYEIIVVDDCGDSKPLFDQQGKWLSKKVKLIHHKINRGLSASRNTGIKAAQGEYIVCLDDDNELMSDFLERTIKNIGNYDAIGVGRIIQYKDFADYVIPKISKFCSIDWGWLFKKDVFNKIQYDENLKANEDTDFGIRFFKQFKADVLKEPLCIAYDIDNPKDSLSYPNERELNGMNLFFEKNLKEYDEPKELWCLYRLMGRKFYRGGYRLQGIKYFWRGFKSFKTFRAFLHFFVILFGWFIYDKFMTIEERVGARLRRK